MIENLPFYVSATFILTTFIAVGMFLYAVNRAAPASVSTVILNFLIPFWLLFQAALTIAGFYLKIESLPPRLPVFAVFPALVTIVLLFIFSRKSLIASLPLKILTLLHIVRIPVELVLFWLFQNSLVPRLMTFEGVNYDILSGITAPLVVWLAFRNGNINRRLLIVWNIFALLLLINIVASAVLSFQTPFQQFAFDQPNRAVLYFPFVWLPAAVVPIVLFCHLASLYQLLKFTSKH